MGAGGESEAGAEVGQGRVARAGRGGPPPRPSPPPPPTTLPTQYAAAAGAADVSVYGWLQCYADAVLLPATTAELAAGVAEAVAASGGRDLTLRASSSSFGSTASFVCPGLYGGGLGSPLPRAPAGTAAPTTVVVLQDSLRGVVAHDAAARTLTVRAGSRLGQVWAWAAVRC